MPCEDCLEIVRETVQSFDQEVEINYIDSNIEEFSEEVGFGPWGIPAFMKDEEIA